MCATAATSVRASSPVISRASHPWACSGPADAHPELSGSAAVLDLARTGRAPQSTGASMGLPGKPDCCWIATAPPTNYPTLTGAHRFDVAVIGAGIVGLTAAYRLAGTDLSVAVLEADRLGRQVTGRSSAKITSQHALIYRYLIDTLGIEQARSYADANRTAMRQIRTWIDELRITCDLEVK